MNDILNELSKVLQTEEDGVGGIRSYAYVNPDMARKLLSLSNGNRPISSYAVNKYKRHMEQGTWDESAPTQFITFNCSGVLINGHHTLTALARSGKTIKLWFLFNAPDSAYYDGGRTRSEADRFCMLDGGSREGFSAYKRAISVCNVLTTFGLEDLQTEENRRDYIKSHIRDFEWMQNYTKVGKRYLSTAPIRTAVLLHRQNGAAPSSLSHFWDVLQSGFAENANDRTVIRLRDWIVSLGKDSRSKEYRSEVLCTVYDVLGKWLGGQQVRAIVPVKEFPVFAG